MKQELNHIGPAVGRPDVDRRKFLNLMAASVALAGTGACTRQPEEKILPFARSPEETVPGEPLYFATAMPLGGYGTGILVESYDGRPIKVEGNPEHPASLGGTDAFAQASVLTLYDPDRAQYVTRAGQLSRWSTFLSALNEELETQRASRGAGIRILTGTLTSPTLGQQIETLLDAYPAARWHQYEPVIRDGTREGARLAYGSYLNTIYRFDRADVVVSLDADFLAEGPARIRYCRDFTSRRRAGSGTEPNRLYVAETVPSITGSMADHRLRLRSSEVLATASLLAAKLGLLPESSAAGRLPGPVVQWISAVFRDLEARRGRTIIVAGDHQPAAVHLLVHAINERLGNTGETVILTDPIEVLPVNQIDSLRELVRDIAAGRVELLVILGGNPAYDAPADMKFAERLTKVRFRAHLSLYHNETAELCDWHVPEAHFLESWSDIRAYDGTASIIQPLIAPLYEGKSAHEVLSALAGRPDRSSYELLRECWQGRSYFLAYRSGLPTPSEEDFESLWTHALHDGFVAGTRADAVSIHVRPDLEKAIGEATRDQASAGGLVVVFRPDPSVWDGRFANNAWLQELPKPLSKLTWDNAAQVSPASAVRLGLSNGELARLKLGDRTVEAPVWISPGHADDTVSLTLGYGQVRAGAGLGCNAYRIRVSDGLWSASGLQVEKTGGNYPLASTQNHHSMEGRSLVRIGTPARESQPDMSLYPKVDYPRYAWGMTIDLNACVGCNACVVACTAENNVPVVGKDEVLRGREMHWVRVDRYYEGPSSDPAIYHQPVMCMHCEKAPCEVVCPVGATVHSSEGLNEMIYNRCVGSRYCANNCPYKVRRFNFRQYADYDTPALKMLNNPEVTVRTRGVIEKCTYCVQRINRARIRAEKEGRDIRDGEITTACEAACPAQAIVFGNLNDPASRVSKLAASARSYTLLEELDTRPRTRYLTRIVNANPDLTREKG